jgi:GT2 family glycosyltransferase
MSSLVKIIILNWNGWKDTIECLESLFQISYLNYQVIVVDNGSTDDSIEKIKDWAEGEIAVGSKPVSYAEVDSDASQVGDISLVLVKLKENLGFARGNNVGIRCALRWGDADYILILNNDTTVAPDFLTQLVEGFEKYPKAALTAPQVIDYYSGSFWQKPIPKRLNLITYIVLATQLYRLSARLLRFNMGKPSRVYAVPGCCMLLKKDAFQKIGLFDETTFLGWEEFIIAERFFQNGLEVYFIPQSKIYHKIGKDTDRLPSLKKIEIFLTSERYFQKKIIKLSFLQRYLIRLVRFLIYNIILIKEKKWKQNVIKLAKIIFGNEL